MRGRMGILGRRTRQPRTALAAGLVRVAGAACRPERRPPHHARSCERRARQQSADRVCVGGAGRRLSATPSLSATCAAGSGRRPGPRVPPEGDGHARVCGARQRAPR